MKQLMIYLFISVTVLFSSCRDKHSNQAEGEKAVYYTCPMHPTVKSNSPGSCPICNMSLIKVEQKGISQDAVKGNSIALETRQQLLAGIATDTVRYRSLLQSSTILGTVALDEELVTSISSRVKGRIDKLYIKSSGTYIRIGEALYSIYSEQLLADEKEYLALTEQKKLGESTSTFLDVMLHAAKNKLSLWGLTSNQIAAIEKTKKTSPLMTFYSPSEGYTTDVMVKEGMYVEVGTTLLKLTGLKQVWIEAQLYADEKMSNSTRYEIHSTTSPYKEYEGNLVFNNPTIEEGKKVQLLQIRVSNPKNELIPGMNVYVRLKSATETVLTIPKTAILLEKMKTVWVKINATTFEQRMVETGAENKHFIEILSGVTEGEVIASSGAYLINSEFILKSGTEMRHNH